MTETIENLRDFNYYKLNTHKHVLVEYIWIDGTGERLRSKTKVY
jgi:glutamine synthetase